MQEGVGRARLLSAYGVGVPSGQYSTRNESQASSRLLLNWTYRPLSILLTLIITQGTCLGYQVIKSTHVHMNDMPAQIPVNTTSHEAPFSA